MKKIITILLVCLVVNGYSQSFSIGSPGTPFNVNNTNLKVIEKSIGGSFGTLNNIGNTIPTFLTNQVDSFADLNIQTMRFPTNHFYLYHYGPNKKGYGFNFDELFWNYKDINAGDATDRTSQVQNKINGDALYNKNIIEVFVETVKQLYAKNGIVVNVIYTANIWQHLRNTGGTITYRDPNNSNNIPDVITSNLDSLNVLPGDPQFNSMMQETIDAITYLKSIQVNGVNIINVTGVEFDNEVYGNWPFMTNQYVFKTDQTRINSYIAVCSTYTQTLKSIWPTIKVAIPFAHYGGPSGNLYNSSVWAENFYDAFSIHHYSGLIKDTTTYFLNLPAFPIYNCEYPLIPSATCSDVLRYNNKYINATLSPTTPTCLLKKQLSDRLNGLDSKNKEYWIIEWNAAGTNNIAGTNILNSIMHADYYYKMLFSEFMQNSRIKNCIYWATTMGYNGPSIVLGNYKQDYGHWGGMMSQDIPNTSNWFINKQATYYPASYVSKIFKNDLQFINHYDWTNWSNTNAIPPFIRTNFTGIDKNNLLIRPFIKTLTNPLTNQIKLYIYFSNMSSTSITVDYANFNINTPYYACSGNQGSTNYTFKPTPGGVVAQYADIAKISYIKNECIKLGYC